MKKVIAFLFVLTLSGCTQTNSKEFKEIVDVKSLSKIEVIDGRIETGITVSVEVPDVFIDIQSGSSSIGPALLPDESPHRVSAHYGKKHT